jgi:hypothetical protein
MQQHDLYCDRISILVSIWDEHIKVLIQQDQQDALFASSLLQSIACTCLEHCLLIIRRYCIYSSWYYFVCVLSAGCYRVPPDDEQIVLHTCTGY